MIVEIVKAICLGIVEGITEWIPISSTGHMILLEEFIQLNASDDFKEVFFVVIQLGAIMAVIFSYFRRLNPYSKNKTALEKREIWSVWYKIIVGCIPAGIIGFIFDDWLNEHLYNYKTVAITLIVYGVLFIIIENYNKKRTPKIIDFNNLNYKVALLIGISQVLALIPGTSRSGTTILGAILLGASRSLAIEYSFFLSIPIMFGASALKLIKFGLDFTRVEMIILFTGMSVAFFVSYITIIFLFAFIRNNDFKLFGYYRIGLGFCIIGYFTIF